MKHRFVVLWDPPINKPSVGCIFDTYEEAWSFVHNQLEPSGWPMNVRVIQAEESKDFYNQIKHVQGEIT
jgi:hypothetical protein